MSIGGIVSIFATADYHNAIVLPDNDKKAVATFQLGFLISAVVFVATLIASLFGVHIAALFSTPALADFLFFMPFYVWFLALWNLYNYWYLRTKNYTQIALYSISQSVSASAIKIGFGIGGFLHWGLLVGTILGQLTATLGSIIPKFKKNGQQLLQVDRLEIKEVAQTYSNFPKFSLIRSIVVNLSGNLPILLLTPYFLLSDIGFFGMALVLALRPINMISSALYQSLYPKLNTKYIAGEHIMPFFKKFTTRSLLIIFPSFLVLYFLLPQLTGFILGAKWEYTGKLIQLMLPWLLLNISINSLAFMPDIFGKQKIELWFEIAAIIVNFCALIVGIYTLNFYGCIALFSATSSFVIVARGLWFYSFIRIYEKSL